MKSEIQKVPSSALKLSFAQVDVGDNGEDTKTVPVKLKALGGEVIESPFFGPLMFDFSGMRHKQRIAIDYNHSSTLLGYVNKFGVEDGLVLGGALIPYKDDDMASEVVYKMKAGIPYESSIDFAPTKPNEVKIERLSRGKSAMVNGKQFEGPLSIVRQWTLGSVAICPRGADSDTEAYLQSKGEDKEKEITIMSSEEKQEEVEAVEAEATEKEAVDAEVDKKEDEKAEAKAEDSDKKEDEAEAVEAEETKSESSEECKLSHADFVQMIEAFGKEKAADYFEQGLSMDESTKRFNGELLEENKALKEQLKLKKAGFSPDKEDKKEKLSVKEEALKRYALSTGQDFETLKAQFTKKEG